MCIIREIPEIREITICDFCGRDETRINIYVCAVCGKDVCTVCHIDHLVDEHNALYLCENCSSLDFTEYIKTHDKIHELNRETHQLYVKLDEILADMKKKHCGGV